jgi:hypothetical protein
MSPKSIPMTQDTPDDRDPTTDGLVRQVPPDVALTFAQGKPGASIMVISMGGDAAGRYEKHMEYWRSNHGLLTEADLTLSGASTIGYTEAQLDALVVGHKDEFKSQGLVSEDDWSGEGYTPKAPTSRMFKAKDPDDDDEKLWIAVLFEQDAAGRIVRVTWYKQKRPDNGQVWRETPTGRFTYVKGSDPTHIADGPWFHFTQGNAV